MLFFPLLIHLLNLAPVEHSAIEVIKNEFEHFIDRFDKPYRNDTLEYHKRIQIFQNSLNQIEYLNSQRVHSNSAYYGVTKYSDLTSEEFLSQINKISKVSKRRKRREKRPYGKWKISDKWKEMLKQVPNKFDWRDRQVVTAVRSQGKCGACWAHSTVATIESMVAIKTGRLTEFSVQQLVDCALTEKNQGCHGGDTCSALMWMDYKNVTLQTARDYPNKDYAETCQMNSDAVGVRIKSNFTCDRFVHDEAKLVQMLATHGPLIAGVDASTWQHYLGGVIQHHCAADLNHAVQITGYDLNGPIPHYKVRNTWDVWFGINGYIHIAIGQNLCGIAEEVSAIDVEYIPKQFY